MRGEAADDGDDPMRLRDQTELAVAREKPQSLEDRFRSIEQKHSGNAHVRELTLRSLRRLINQVSEEITRFQLHATVGK